MANKPRTRNTQTKVVYEKESTVSVVDENGEIKESKSTETSEVKYSQEPAFVKLYLDHLGKFKGVSTTYSPILYAFLQRTTYANPQDDEGGMLLVLNKGLKTIIAKRLGTSLTKVDHAVTEFVRADYMRRVAKGVYQFNPDMFGLGDWRSINNVRATYHYNSGKVEAKATFARQRREKAVEITVPIDPDEANPDQTKLVLP